MFKLVAVRTVNWPVVVNIPLDGGKTRPERFAAQYTLLSQDEQAEVLEQLSKDDAPDDLLERVLCGWDESVKDESGAPLPFTAQNKAAMLAIPYVRVALLRAYVQASTGNAAARKNV